LDVKTQLRWASLFFRTAGLHQCFSDVCFAFFFPCPPPPFIFLRAVTPFGFLYFGPGLSFRFPWGSGRFTPSDLPLNYPGAAAVDVNNFFFSFAIGLMFFSFPSSVLCWTAQRVFPLFWLGRSPRFLPVPFVCFLF